MSIVGLGHQSEASRFSVGGGRRAVVDALLSDNDRKEALSLAYLAAVAAKAGFATARPDFDRDSIDLMILAGGSMHPQLHLQVKATASPDWQSDGLHFQLRRKNYNDLRVERRTPLILTVLELPADETEWLMCGADKLVMRRCAWWLSLRDQPELEGESKVVVLPTDQRLDPLALAQLMERIREGTL